MTLPVVQYPHAKDLSAFLVAAETELLSAANRRQVTYPSTLTAKWNASALASRNVNLLSDLSSAANVYAIFTASKASNSFTLRYLGKTTRALARQRLRSHLFKKSAGTGAKLAQVIEHVQSGGTVAIAWVAIEPEAMRNYVEEELISRHREADWNRGSSKGESRGQRGRS